MRFDKFLIFFFLFVSAIGVFGVKSQNDEKNAMMDMGSSRELLSSSYVAENLLSANGEFSEGEKKYIFNNKSYDAPIESLRKLSQKPSMALNVLGDSTEEKRIVVDLKNQRVYGYEGQRLALNFLVSTGLWGRTPTGSFRIWYKVRSQTMKGGDRLLGTYYYLPNVQFIQYFNQGIGFHSTYWHNNYGNPMSHGCINMTTTDAETLYHWASPVMPSGSRIFRSSSNNQGTRVDVVDSWSI